MNQNNNDDFVVIASLQTFHFYTYVMGLRPLSFYQLFQYGDPLLRQNLMSVDVRF